MAREGFGPRIGLAIALTLLTIAPAASGFGTEGAGDCGRSETAPRQATTHQMRSAMLCLINRAREAHGVHRLTFDAELRSSATGHSRDMVRHRYFSHTGSGGSTVGRRVGGSGYGSWSAVAEVIGEGPARLGSPYAVFERWMESSEHRTIILEPRFSDFGVGVWPGSTIGGGPKAATYTVDFATHN